jgi:hypothetical protein
LVTFAEVLAMYLLVWSPTPWTLITPQPPQLGVEEQQRYTREQVQIDQFRHGLPGAARVFAHLSTLMIFDDHDITDDWNLSAQWEETGTTWQCCASRSIVSVSPVGNCSLKLNCRVRLPTNHTTRRWGSRRLSIGPASTAGNESG